MKIFFISFFFPPFNTIGAIRTGKMAKYLVSQGHEIRIISADDQPLPSCLLLELPDSLVSRTPWVHLGSQIKQRFRKDIGEKMSPETKNYGRRPKETNRTELLFFKKIYESLFRFPDSQVGWLPFAVRKGRKILKEWTPDIIFASAMPYTSLLVANRLSKEFQIPWVAEFRDLWVDNHYREYGPLRNWIDKKMENSTLQNSSGLVTVSEPAAEILRSKYTQPCVVIPNGFDPNDFQQGLSPSPEGPLKIVYTGSIYQGKRDPSILFKALDLLGDLKDFVRMEFYGPDLSLVGDLAKHYGCEENLLIHEQIPYKESLVKQQQADILLLLLWDNPEEKGVFTGKVFEYLGARRPILIIGPEDNVASQTIIERRAGIVATDPEAIAEHLKIWIENKKKGIPIESPPEEATKGFTREEQARMLAEFLESIVLESRDKQ